jgi:hypothetical protein
MKLVGTALGVMLGLGCQRATEPTAVAPASHEAGGVEQPGLAPGQALPGVKHECGTYATLEHGPYQLMNNMFAREEAPGPYEQCLLQRQVAGKTELGWSWSWPGFRPQSYGFPELIFGWKPWSERSTDPRLPVLLANLQRLDVQYAVQTESSGKQSLALGTWLTNTGEVTANPQSIRTEVVVWLDYVDGINPAGQLVETVQLKDQSYELWSESSHGDRGDGSGWDLYYFKAAERRPSGTVQLLPFLDHLQKQGRVQSQHFVASVEFGSELMGGTGTTWVDDYQVLLTTATAPPQK